MLRRLFHPLYRKLETSVHPLRYLFVEVTQRCNLACRHCGSDCGREPATNELSTSEWLAFFAYLRDKAGTRDLTVVVTGGEPLCHPELPRLLAGLRDNGLRFGMVTNAWALDTRRVELLMSHGLFSITVSLDGLAPQHDDLRGKKGSFERAVQGIRNLVEARVPQFDVVTCVHPGNLAQLPEVSALLQQLGVPAWRLFAIFPKGRAKRAGDLRLDTEGWHKLFSFIRAERRACADKPFRVNFSCEAFLPPELDLSVRDEPYFCRAGISIGSVLSDGSISACPNITRKLVQGNIRTDDFATVWEERFASYRDRAWMRRGECQSCGDWNRCLGNSLHLWDPEAESPCWCIHHALTGHSGAGSGGPRASAAGGA